MRTPHLIAALAVLVLAAAALVGGDVYARSVEAEYVHALAPLRFSQKDLGAALQRAALAQSDLLPIYGSSEFEIPDPFDAGKVFRLYPTDFAAFPVAGKGAETLIYLQRLAAVGSDLRGKKVVISLSPGMFLETTTPPDLYAGNFSLLQANELAFNTDLDLGLKKAAARRMLEYPQTLNPDPLLRFALENLADGSPFRLGLWYAALPLGRLHTLALGFQDHWETLSLIRQQQGLDPNVPRRAALLHWDSLLNRAEARYVQQSNSNPFGFDNSQWEQWGDLWTGEKDTLSNKKFLTVLNHSQAWTDLDLLLRELRDLGAQPLILSMPFPGPFYDYLGVSADSRQVYYQKLVAAVNPYGVPVIDFQDHDADKYFLWNPGSHLSSKGWIFYDQAMDAFFHSHLQ